MIVKKKFEVSAEKIDDVVLELAEEIKKGWTITQIKYGKNELSAGLFSWPTYEVILERKENCIHGR